MSKKSTLFFAAIFLAHLMWAQPQIELEVYATGLDEPVDIASAGDERLFIVERQGLIRIIDGNQQLLNTPFLDIDSKVSSNSGERGLLGLTFHPDYAQNGYFYVNYTNNSGDTRIARYTVSATEPDVADPNSELILLEVEQPFPNHNAGDLAFGPDGMLYFGLGDGGSGDDPLDNGQDRLTLLGKLMRIDVDNGNPYSIPEDNPFAEDDFTLDEIWAIGLRNPWRFSFDRETGDLWIADVGQDDWEEIDFQPVDSPGGENYGWRCYEGNQPFNLNGCPPASTLSFPVFEYPHTGGFCAGSITGGFVYRGADFPGLQGYYFFSDFCDGRIDALKPDGQGGFEHFPLMNGANNEFVSFGEDAQGELYLAGVGSGNIYRLLDFCQGNAPLPPEISTNGNLLLAPDGFAEYQWFLNGEPIAGANSSTYLAMESGDYSVAVTNALGCSSVSDLYMIVVSSIKDQLPADAFSISPNPFDQNFYLQIQLPDPGTLHMRILNTVGQTVWQESKETDGQLERLINTASWPSGMYLMYLEQDGKSLTRKVIKE